MTGARAEPWRSLLFMLPDIFISSRFRLNYRYGDFRTHRNRNEGDRHLRPVRSQITNQPPHQRCVVRLPENLVVVH